MSFIHTKEIPHIAATARRAQGANLSCIIYLSSPFAELLAHPAIVDAPLILETPGEEPEHGREVVMLMKMRDK
jgi:endonuclease IV